MKRITSSGRRRNPGRTSLSERNVKPDPIDQFENWFRPVLRSKNPQPCAMALATASKKGLPTVRIVLLKNYDRNGFTFYTNYESVKGKQLADNPRAALLFYWPQFERQVRIEGSCRKTDLQESYRYFASRPRDSRIGAWASRQSERISDRRTLEQQFRNYQNQFRGKDVPLPGYWGGFRLVPTKFEFWQARPGRLHDRIAYVLKRGRWDIIRYSP